MHIKDIIKKTEAYAADITDKHSLELVDVEYVKEGSEKYLRIYIDKPGSVTIDDCEKVSRELEAILDREDPIDEAYILEVSSPGLDRVLKKDYEYEKYKGRAVEIKLFAPIDGKKEFEGELIGLSEGLISIKTADGKLSFEKGAVASCRLAVIF